MAQSFWANAATRLHPEEWASGTAAGIAAAMMHGGGWTARDVFERHMGALQDALKAFGAPLEWTHVNVTI